MKIKKTEVVSEDKRQRVDALSIAKETAKELQNLRGEFETSQLAVKDYLDKSGGILQYAIDKLSEAAKNQPDMVVNVEPLNELIKKTLESFELKLEQIQKACETIKVPDVNNEFRPDITVEQAEIDLTKLEDLLRKELPKLFEKFLEAIPETPPLDLTELDKKFQKMFELLEKNLKKQMPMFVGGGGGGGNTTVDNFPSEYPLPAGQVSTLTPQTDALTDTELRATPVDVDTGLTQPTTPSDTQPVSATSLPLPSGAATEAKQDDIITAIGSIGGSTKYVTRIDDTTTANVTYIGKAVPTGSAIATSSAVWQVTKIDESSGTVITYADGGLLFNNIWDNRASLTYA